MDSEDFAEVLDLMRRSPRGHSLLEEARGYWKEENIIQISRHLKWGDVSRTDATLTRSIDPVTGEETRDRSVTIFLRRGATLDELVLDLSHELVHATKGHRWDPYDPELTADRYVQEAIEGEGGEVEALIAECEVGSELRGFRPGIETPRCSMGSIQEDGLLFEERRRRAVEAFYALGSEFRSFVDRLSQQSPLREKVNAGRSVFISSTGNAPYPVALIREFEALNQMACANSRRRIASPTLESITKNTQQFLQARCGR